MNKIKYFLSIIVSIKNETRRTLIKIIYLHYFYVLLIIKEYIYNVYFFSQLPFFLSELTVKDINLGSALPKIHQSSSPSIDERGLWVDVDVSYNGSFHMTLETKLSLRRLKGDSEEFWDSISEVSKETESLEQSVKCVVDYI